MRSIIYEGGIIAELNWGNVLIFNSESDYYETLGFLTKDEEYVRVYTEDNDKLGAWAQQGRLQLRNVNYMSIPNALMNAFKNSTDGRISATAYVKNLRNNHNFTKDVDPMGAGHTKWIYKETIEKVLETVPEEYENDFYRGYHWNCEVIARVRDMADYEANLDEETVQDIGGYIEGSKKEYYTTKYERDFRNREAAIRIHGTRCMICGFDYGEKYGELGKGYIEVHHIKPLADLEEEVVVNPRTDLVCVCSNCHRMLHRFRKYIVSVDELKRIVEDNV